MMILSFIFVDIGGGSGYYRLKNSTSSYIVLHV